jgi:FKBP-type peptidyl-prolyl cis-trans isomerase SlyD
MRIGKIMSETHKSQTIRDGHVVTLGYTLTVDGKVIDTSEGEGNAPVVFIQGIEQIVPGLENVLYGMAVGDSKNVVVPAAEGYGDYDPEAFDDVPRSEFPPEIPLEPGIILHLRDNDDDVYETTVVSVNKDTVRLTFNHPLAGKELHFSVTVLAVREAMPEELEHGHVHDH